MAINPRKILNLPVPKIEVGEPANLSIFDTEEIWTVDITQFKSKSKNSPFNGRLMTGNSVAVINNRQIYIDSKYWIYHSH